MGSYYSTETVPLHIAAYVLVVLWSHLGGGVSLRHAVIFGAIYFNNIVFELGATVRLDYLICLGAGLLYVGSWRARRPPEAWWLIAVLVVLAASSVLVGVAPAYSLRKLAILGIYLLGATVVLSPAAHGRPMIDVVREFLAVGNRVLALSLVAYVVLLATGWDMGFIKDRDQEWLRGPMLNPNTFGSTASTLLMLNSAVALRSEGRTSRHGAWAAVAAACVFLSYTRAAWILAVAFGGVLLAWWLAGGGRIRGVHFVLASGAVLAAIGIGPLGAALQFDEKFTSLFALSEGTAVDRLVLANQGLQDWLASPWLGTGFQTYEFLVGADADPTVWVPSVLFVQLLQYGGTFALLGFLAFLVVLHARSRRALGPSGGVRTADVLVPLVLGVDLMVVAYQVTSAIVLGYFWFFAVLVAYVVDERLSAAPAGSPVVPASATPSAA
jgi:hypothetical protein